MIFHQLNIFYDTYMMIIFVILLKILDVIYPLHYPSVSPYVYDQSGYLLSVHPNGTQNGDDYIVPIELSDVSDDFLKLLLNFEDRRFVYHPGVDPLSMIRGCYQFFKNGRIISGASTLTMQLAQQLYPGKRSVYQKIKQMIRAIQLEYHYRKTDILKMYLTYVPYGKNLRGLVMASHYYFGKKPSQLNSDEQLFLIALPQSPQKFLNRDFVKKRLYALAKRLKTKNFKYTIETRSYPIPKKSFHLAYGCVKNTTIDQSLQDDILSTVSISKDQDCAILVVDHIDQRVIAYIGSINCPHGIDMVQATRSFGSTLKPFVYGAAMDAEFIYPHTLIDDQPISIQGYEPLNFSKQFHGTLTIERALQLSLNTPVVQVLHHYGIENFYQKLKNIGIHIRVKNVSLALGLGGGGLSLYELVGLYTSLARNGYYKPPSFYKNCAHKDLPFLSPTTCHCLLTILQKMQQDFHPHIAFKTGTSYGHRDSWSIGVGKRYTVGVWVGRPDGMPCPGQTGRTHATPIMFSIFQRLKEVSAVSRAFDPEEQPHIFKNHTTHGFKMLSPLKDSHIFLNKEGILKIEWTGGTGPYHIFINDTFYKETVKHHHSVNISVSGFYRINVYDKNAQKIKTYCLINCSKNHLDFSK
jgi:penicillin-binding protein 1C